MVAGRGRKTLRYRKKGGASTEDINRVQSMIDSGTLTPTIVNPESKFVVVTYWWGRGNANRNLQRPCPEEIIDQVKEEMEESLAEEDEEYKSILETFITARDKYRSLERSGTLTEEDLQEYKTQKQKRLDYIRPYFLRDDTKVKINQQYNKIVEEGIKSGTVTPPKIFDTMIAEWEASMRGANCNFMAVEYPFERKDYQNAINGKPMFIKKALDSAGTTPSGVKRGVLYIDGDMFIHMYPSIFDMQNVDFMARGWNIDPRSSPYYEDDVCFDPYIFETSGGTMYFGPTDEARVLLDLWVAESSTPQAQGKADDRILSMAFTARKFALEGTVIQLPIEYLWLTDLYAGRFENNPTVAAQARSFIEHPACLTGEERAADQGAASNRLPIGYESIERATLCEQRGGVFYEYVFFENEEMVQSFADYLNFLRTYVNNEGEHMFEVIPYAQTFGRFQTLSQRNEASATTISSTLTVTEGDTVDLPFGTTIPTILAHLKKKCNVTIGGSVQLPLIETDFAGKNISQDEVDPFHYSLQLDTKSPMYISHKNRILYQLLSICETLDSINEHLQESYTFLSRIRWSLKTDKEVEEQKQKSIRSTKATGLFEGMLTRKRKL